MSDSLDSSSSHDEEEETQNRNNVSNNNDDKETEDSSESQSDTDDDEGGDECEDDVEDKLDRAGKGKRHMNDEDDDMNESELLPKKSRVEGIVNNNNNDALDEEEKDYIGPPDGNMRIVASHYNELKETGRVERQKSRIFHMRNFNNWVKSQLINEYLMRIKSQQRVGDPMRVLDLGCGKGGDLLKWEKASITHLICTDLAAVSLEQCKKRYDDLMDRASKQKFGHKFTAEFIACDSTLTRLRERYKDPSLKLNLVSCQFAFHYSFESLSQADCMVRNAAECLQPGGYFIATIPDANEIMRRLRASDNNRKFGNDLYNIEFLTDTNPPPLFGCKYTFHLEGVVDCPEFLVHFPVLLKLCRKHGLKLERKNTFAEYYEETIPKGRTLMQRMNGLEQIYPKSFSGNDEEYAHLKSITKSGNMSKPYGTLSKSEWEAITIYLVCAFKKCKNTWDAQGKPVFEFD